jgi:hypothetical protein
MKRLKSLLALSLILASVSARAENINETEFVDDSVTNELNTNSTTAPLATDELTNDFQMHPWHPGGPRDPRPWPGPGHEPGRGPRPGPGPGPGYPYPPARYTDVVCSSHGHRPEFCPVYGARRADLIQQYSSQYGECIPGRTYFVTYDGIQVTDGCRGLFRVWTR